MEKKTSTLLILQSSSDYEEESANESGSVEEESEEEEPGLDWDELDEKARKGQCCISFIYMCIYYVYTFYLMTLFCYDNNNNMNILYI